MPPTDSTVIRKRWTPDADRVKVWEKESEDGEEQSFIRVPVSSTSEDRDGDEFTEDGLKSMRSQYRDGTVNLFPDHGASEDKYARYPWKDIMGRWVDAEIEGDELFATARLNGANEDAQVLRDYLDEEMAVGFSVGFRALDADGDMREGFEFRDVDLLETSAVGIPSNPDGVAAMSAETDNWRKQLDDDLASDGAGEEGNMPEDDKNTDPPDGGTDDDEQRSVDVEELRDDVDSLDEKMDSVLEILQRSDEESEKEDDDGEDDDDDEDDDGEDEKSLTVTGTADQLEELRKSLDDVRDESNDEVKLADPQTEDFAEDDEQAEKDDSSGDTRRWLE